MKVKFGAIFIALVVLIPIFSIFFEIALGDYSLLEHFFKYLFVRYIQGTFVVEARILVLVWLSPYFGVASGKLSLRALKIL